MTWNAYKIDVTLATPLHCGDLPMGFISRTLRFVPAHIPWYALVVAVCRSHYATPDASNYIKVENFLDNTLCFTPFFIQGENTPLYPWDKDNGGNEIESNYLCAHTATAIDYTRRAALEGQLFEMEAISASPLDNSSSATKLTGYAFLHANQDGDLSSTAGNITGIQLSELIRHSTWGGERNRGWGSLAKVEMQATDTVFGAPFNGTGNRPALHWAAEQAAPFYLQHCPEQSSMAIQSVLRPITGRRHHAAKGSGQEMDKVLFVHDIGWRSTADQKLLFYRRNCQLANN